MLPTKSPRQDEAQVLDAADRPTKRARVDEDTDASTTGVADNSGTTSADYDENEDEDIVQQPVDALRASDLYLDTVGIQSFTEAYILYISRLIELFLISTSRKSALSPCQISISTGVSYAGNISKVEGVNLTRMPTPSMMIITYLSISKLRRYTLKTSG
jgi:hypothetical protein